MRAPWDHLTLSDCRPAVSREVIKSVSAKIGLPFPKLYVDFLLAHNGGSVENLRLLPRRFPLQGCKRDTHGLIQVFFNVSTRDVVNLAREYKVFRDRIPPGLLPIASDPGGNLICLPDASRFVQRVASASMQHGHATTSGPHRYWLVRYMLAPRGVTTCRPVLKQPRVRPRTNDGSTAL